MALILVVDDDPDFLVLMGAHFGARGHEVVGARSCDEAAAAAARRAPDLVLLDFCLPRVNGARLIEDLRAAERTRRTPVIVMTAAALSWVEVRLPDDPQMRLVEKPFDFELVDALVDEMLAARPA